MLSTLGGLAVLLLIIGPVVLHYRWLSTPRQDDIPLIKAKLEEQERRVVDIRFDRFVDGGRFGLSYRQYRAVVRSPVGGPDQVWTAGVWANLFGARGLVHLNREQS